MNSTLPRTIVAASLLLACGPLLIARADWTYPPTISLAELREQVPAVAVQHPRLLVHKEDLERLRQFSSEDPVRQAMADAILRHANQVRNDRPITYAVEGRRLLRQSRLCVQRVLTLATAYHLTGDSRYAARAQREMLAAARFPDWNPNHFLDVAEMTFALAIGYDWLYDQLESGARDQIRKAIVEKGVSLGLEGPYAGCRSARDNWGQVCNGALTVGALAVLEDEPDLAARAVDSALQNVTASMSAYAPAGGYPEGPDYWSYGTSYNVLLLAALDSVFGTDFGLSRAPGFDVTGQFPSLITGPSGFVFNYADSDDHRNPEPELYWLSSRFGRPDWLLGERDRLLQTAADWGRKDAQPGRDRFLPLALLWWRTPEQDTDIRMPLHWSSEGDKAITVHRSSWTDPNATFVSVKAGSPSDSHGQMDVGSFVLDAHKVRWALDLGNEPYRDLEARGLSLWRFDQESDRWRVFRQSSFAHNTLVIDGRLQRADGRAAVVGFSDHPSFAHSIVDMSSLYEGQATSVRRGVALLPTGQVLIQDELRGLTPGSRIRWGMMTRSRPEESRAASVVLRQDDKELKLTMLTVHDSEWETIDTSRRVNDWDSPNPGTRMVTHTVVAPPSGELTIAVLAAPGAARESEPLDVTVRPLDDWAREPSR